MITILGARGVIGAELTRLYQLGTEPLRLVSRNPVPMGSAEVISADLTGKDATIHAVAGARVVHLVVGLKYSTEEWQRSWPKIMENTIEACERADARLVFFDNVYMYGKVDGAMTEETPYAPVSKKGEVRASIANALITAVKAGRIRALIARSADFYGPDASTGVANVLVFAPLARGKKPSWLGNPDVPHSQTFTADAARGAFMLAEKESAWNQIWHLPTAPNPPSGRDFIAMAAREFNASPKFRTLNRPMLFMGGLFDPTIRELPEMLYQHEYPYLFDCSKFERAFRFSATPYVDGVRKVVESYKRSD
jgi:nucleoside-diphosphate-sugar epimerase